MSDTLPMTLSSPITPAQETMILNLVRRAARAEIIPRFRTLDSHDITTKSHANDLVTEADTQAEAMIARGLQMAFPSALVVGEEAAAHAPHLRDDLAGAELAFLIDPVDGTWNFANGLPLFGTMIAATRFGTPVYSLIYDPVGDDAFVANDTSDALWHPVSGRARALSTAAAKPLAQMQGHFPLHMVHARHRAAAAMALTSLGNAANLRCSAHEYRLLAQGAVDFVFAAQMTPWDHAAGVLLCQQAGGHAAMLDTTAYSAALTEGYLLCASSKETWITLQHHFKAMLDG